MNPLEAWLLAGLAPLTGAFCFSRWRWLGQWTLDEELARASAVKTAWLRYALILLIAATVILSAKTVGVLLAFAVFLAAFFLRRRRDLKTSAVLVH